jgi:integrase
MVVGYSKRVAVEAERKFYTDFKNREIHGVPHQANKPKEWTVEELLDWYLELPDVKSLKSYQDAKIRAKTVKTYFKNTLVKNLKPADIRAYQQYRKKEKVKGNGFVSETRTISHSTINKEVGVLKTCCYKAIEDDKIERNPCIGVKCLKEGKRDRVASKEEFRSLQAQLHEQARDIITILYYTGMRRGELLSLNWDRVDLKNGYIYLGAEHTKTQEPRKVPFMHPEVKEVFERRGGNPRRIRGKVFSQKCMKTAFREACKRTGIKNLRMHDFRHTAATNMRKAKIDTATVMKICGWKSVAMFMRYNKVDDEDLKAASVAMAQVEEKGLTSDSVSA